MNHGPTTSANRTYTKPIIDEFVISAYFLCPRKSYLLLCHCAHNSSLPPPIEYAQVLNALADDSKQVYLQNLRNGDGGNRFSLRGKLEDGAAYLLDTVVDVVDLRAHFPLLRKVQQPSDLGRYSYEPGIFAGTARVSKEQTATLYYLAHVLAQQQGVAPKNGFVVAADARTHKVNLQARPFLLRSKRQERGMATAIVTLLV